MSAAARGARRSGLAAGLLLALAVAPAYAESGGARVAQVGPPVRLTPAPAAPSPQTPPSVTAPEIPPPATSLPAAPLGPSEGAKSAIEVTKPPPVDTETVGLADPAKLGLPAAPWKDSARALIEQVIADVPADTVSRPARDLARRLLIVAAAPPAGQGTVAGRSFVGVRAAKLFDMGDIEDAAALAQLVPSRDWDESLARLQLDAAFAAYDNNAACTAVRTQIGRFGGPYWQKALIFCQLLANEQDRAQLGLTILQEQKAPEDDAFDRLFAKLSGDARAKVDKLPEPTPLHLAMMRAANLPLPAALATTNDPLILRMIATSPNAPAELRLAAAERAEAYGSLPTPGLAQIYDSLNLTADQVKAALETAQSDRGPRGRALLYRAAKEMPVGTQRAELLQKTWRLARERGVYPTTVRVDLPLLLELQPGPDLMFVAPDATRALLFTGKAEEAQRWYAEVRTEAASGNELAATAEALLSPLVWLADPNERKANVSPLPARFAAWQKAQQSLDAGSLPARTALLVTLLTSTGDQPDPVLLGPLLSAKPRRDAVQMPDMGLWLGLGAAFDAGRIGETALFSLAVLGPSGPSGAAPQTTSLVLDALRAASLDTDARALALEAAILGGL
ncbi:MAG TPA: hypothetical protein VMH36_04845 [Alphaproteobacteria bacterium]|nr:hypothetical protein [Alphaproteobacteria bacterium]